MSKGVRLSKGKDNKSTFEWAKASVRIVAVGNIAVEESDWF